MSSPPSTPPTPPPGPSARDCLRCGKPIPPASAYADAPGGLCPACLLAAGFFTQAASDDTVAIDTPAPSPAELAPEFPALEIIELLGQGGMGAVYKARQRHLDRLVALKLLRPGLDADPTFADRFVREARSLAQLNHPGIVTLHEFGHTPGGRYFILMEFVDGVNLRRLLSGGRISPREALAIVPPLCDALQYAHDRGLVHRDIKPENILVDRLGRVKIADFGLAKLAAKPAIPTTPADAHPTAAEPIGHSSLDIGHSAAGGGLTEAGGVMGTPRYMAPEQREHPAAVDHRADIYALGVVLYQMLTGELPDEKQLRPPSRRVHIDVRLDEIVLRALEPEPSLRYQQASQVKTHLAAYADAAHEPAAPEPTAAASSAPTNTPPPIPPLISPAIPPPPVPPPPAFTPPQPTPPPHTAPTAAEFSAAVLARDYQLNIGSCLNRGWALLCSDFWPLVGLTALVLALLSVLNSSHVAPLGLVVSGPLLGGLYLHFLHRMRGLPGGIDVVFSGFRRPFLHLFLGGFVCTSLTILSIFCLVLPVYLFVAWLFTLPLIIDRKLDFWPAMELSRRAVSKHWWKLFGLALVLGLLGFAGMLALFVGLLVAAPLAIATLMFAYEDIFNPPAPATSS